MAKLSGFFMSTLLIVLCLWINVRHYPNAAVVSPSNDVEAAPIDVVPQSVSPASEPVAPPVAPASNEEKTAPSGGLLADSGVPPKLLDVSASRPTGSPSVDPAALPPVLSPTSFPVDGAEIDDAPADAESNAPEPSPLPPSSFGVSKSLSTPADSTAPTSGVSISKSLSAPQDVRRSASKPRGAKYVRVPDVEIDAFTGGVRSASSSGDEPRVVGATRADRTLSVAAPVF